MPPEAVSGLVGAAVGLVFGPTVNAQIPQDDERFSLREAMYRVGPLAVGIMTSFAVHDGLPFWLALGYTVVANSLFAENRLPGRRR